MIYRPVDGTRSDAEDADENLACMLFGYRRVEMKINQGWEAVRQWISVFPSPHRDGKESAPVPGKRQSYQKTARLGGFGRGSGPGRIRTFDLTVMLPTTAFAAPFGFVGWTIPSPPEGCLPSSLYTFPGAIGDRRDLRSSGLGSGLPYPTT